MRGCPRRPRAGRRGWTRRTSFQAGAEQQQQEEEEEGGDEEAAAAERAGGGAAAGADEKRDAPAPAARHRASVAHSFSLFD
jgi:hypothetical protein